MVTSLEKKNTIQHLNALLYMTGKALEKNGKEVVFKPHGLTVVRFIMLHIINKHPNHKIDTRKLQKMLDVSAANMTGRIDVLERDGLVRRKTGKDRRTQIVELSAKGKKLITKVEKENEKALQKVYKGFTSKEIKSHIHFLTTILERMGDKMYENCMSCDKDNS